MEKMLWLVCDTCEGEFVVLSEEVDADTLVCPYCAVNVPVTEDIDED